jgi:hypothetical protein
LSCHYLLRYQPHHCTVGILWSLPVVPWSLADLDVDTFQLEVCLHECDWDVWPVYLEFLSRRSMTYLSSLIFSLSLCMVLNRVATTHYCIDHIHSSVVVVIISLMVCVHGRLWYTYI